MNKYLGQYGKLCGRVFFAGWIFCLPVFSMSLLAADINWTGAAGDGLWNNPVNWAGGVLPGENDRAVFGAAATNGAHIIIVNDYYKLSQIYISGGEQRQFSFNQAGDGKLGIYTDIEVAADVTADVVFNVPIEITRATASAVTLKNYSDYIMIFNQLFNGHSNTIYFDGGKHEFNGPFKYNLHLWPTFSPGDLTIRSPDFAVARNLYLGSVAFPDVAITVRFGLDCAFGRDLEVFPAAAFLQNIVAGTADLTVTFERAFKSSTDDALVTFLENGTGSTGRFILKSTGSGDYGNHTLPFATLSNTFIQFSPSVSAEMKYGSNTNRAMIINGQGHLWKAGAGTLTVRTANSYAGRTMIEAGILQLDSQQVGEDILRGQLPTGTIVEIASGTTFNLNGIDQTIGGLRGWRGLGEDGAETFGIVNLNGAALTIDAQTGSAFGGAFEGTGALVKAGNDIFTLTNGYTNAVGRTLRAEAGLVEVIGPLDIVDGSFELAGGCLTAGRLDSARQRWDVTLNEACEGQVLVDTETAADLTEATLQLAMAPDYAPQEGTQFILLQADTITGAEAGGTLFQYIDGRRIEVNGVWFRVSLTENSDQQIVLKAIPPVVPGTIITCR